MVKNWITIPSSPRRIAKTLSSYVLLGVIGLAAASLGCAGASEEPAEDQGILVTARQGMGEIITGHEQTGTGFTFNLQHVAYENGYFGYRWGLPGGYASTTYGQSTTFAINNLTPGYPYTFAATECEGGGYGFFPSKCTAWTEPTSVYRPWPNTKWGYGPSLTAEALGAAWGAAYWPVDGVNTYAPMCTAYNGAGIYPGYWVDGACKFARDGAAQTADDAYVLTEVSPTATWAPVMQGFLPSGAVVAGYSGGAPLYACSAEYEGAQLSGWTHETACNVVHNGEPRAIPKCKVLVN